MYAATAPRATALHRTDTLVQSWLFERQQLTALLCTLPDLHNQDALMAPAQQAHLVGFCEALMDYISAGHFEIYRCIIHQSLPLYPEDARWVLDTMDLIDASTDAALAFNDQLDQQLAQGGSDSRLVLQLAALVQCLEQRFGLEDQLIRRCHLRDHAATRH